MILIADSGSTKCSWAECSKNGEIIQMHQTVGFNPKYTSEKSLLNALTSSTLNDIKDKVTEIHFYGAGCSAPARNSVLAKPMQAFFQYAKIHIKHDLEAAVKATYKDNPIICSIIGTGSNSCFYDGETITENAPSLGYIFGDEASGNYFGKQLINLYINKALPKEIVAKFENWTPERADDIIENIYDLEKPNLYLASFFRFMHEHKNEEIFDSIFKNGIQHFFELHIKCFENYRAYPLTFIGSVAFYLSDYINEIAGKEGMKVQEIIQSPIENLVKAQFLK
jgi:N-acetylglucosamine kinase-like BadF-type ATPase